MRKLVLIITTIIFSLNLQAFHIVGGEIELVHLEDFNYQLNLIQYFDRAQSDNTTPDGSVTVFVFRNSDDSFIQQFTLPLQGETRVEYTNPECAIGDLVTGRILYSTVVSLDPDVYSEEEGYYIVWERCCRNEAVNNIVSPGTTGMTYILDFPPIMKDGEPFVNSSPTILPPLSDYACVDQLYYTDFRGTDTDGDSLTYTLVAPLNSSAAVPIPTPTPKPHFAVRFADGITETNIVPGNPSLSISDDGFLTVEPSNPGLYVFSVLVKEYRDQELIGQVTRDFQMLVIDGCNPPDPPKAAVQLPGDDEIYEEDAFLSFTVFEEKCFDFQVGNIGPEENVMVRVVPVNFDGSVEEFQFSENQITADSSVFQVCVPECPLKPDEPYIIDLIAQDDACPLPQMDTVRLTIDVEPPANQMPRFVDIPDDRMDITIDEDSFYSFDIEGRDDDGDTVDFRLYSPFFSPEQFGMSLTVLRRDASVGEARFDWDTNCLVYDFSEKTEFELGVIVDDEDFCNMPGDTLWLDLEVILPPNTNPIITSTLTTTDINIGLNNVLTFDVEATDEDGDMLNLRLDGDGFNPFAFNVQFEDQEGTGQVNSTFSWDLTCGEVGIFEETEFIFHLVADDEDKCQTTNFDSLTFTVNVVPDFNNKPLFDDLAPQELLINNVYEYEIDATDLDDSDFVNVDLLPGLDIPPSSVFQFEPGNGRSRATAKLRWTPTCDILGSNLEPRTYDIVLLAFDDRCPVQEYDTLELSFTFSNIEVLYNEFQPPNVFTPNGDNLNDTYSLSNHPNPNFNLPLDNCIDQFISFTVIDRSGVEVYKTKNRDFVWDGDGLSSGVYYYYVKYANSDYKGTLSILH
jgi:hypothetical protein